MRLNGRILGALIGLFIAGPFGAIMGFYIGSWFDQGLGPRQRTYRRKQVEQAFFEATFILMGYVAKADGKVHPEEIKLAEAIMNQMLLNKEKRAQAMRLFYRGKNKDFDYQAVLQKVAPFRLSRQMFNFLHHLEQIASATGHISTSQQALLENIKRSLGLSFSGFGGQYSHQHYQQGGHRQTYQRNPQEDPYKVLGIKPSASEKDIRKTYRRLMSKYHPDKLSAKGASPAELKQATEKTQRIRKAYEAILNMRGYKK